MPALRPHLILLLALFVAGCTSKPHYLGRSFAPPKLRLEKTGKHPNEKYSCESREYLRSYTTGVSEWMNLGSDPERDRCEAFENQCPEMIIVGGCGYFEPDSLSRFENERGTRYDKPERPYRVGLALAGGGTKAAGYSMGVLAGLFDRKDEELLGVEAISSVSGGSYAALWYYSRLIDDYQISSEHLGMNRNFRNVFKDCLPRRYAPLLGLFKGSKTLCPESELSYPSNRKPPSERENWKDEFRFQNHLRGYQDIISKDFDASPATGISGAGAKIAKNLGLTLLSLPFYAVTNLLFDHEDLTLSPTALTYFRGIDRTYSLRPFHCEPYRLPVHGDDACTNAKGRPSPNAETARGHTMSALANLYYHQAEYDAQRKALGRKPLPKIPFWIVNTTATVARTAGPERRNLESTVFEFTPYGFGSRHYGRWIGTPEGMPLDRAVGVSGAFLDSNQREWGRVQNAVVGAVLRGLNQNWGISISNPRYRSEVRSFHKILPFPLYFFHRNLSTRTGSWIHLSDGGQSENTGIWSLIRRGASKIILADNGQDRDGRFVDLCRLREKLEIRQLYLEIPELAEFALTCEAKHSYDLEEWPVRVLRGCISSTRNDTCVADGSEEYFADLFVLKPAISKNKIKSYMDQHECKKVGALRADAETISPGCADALRALRDEEAGYEDFPAELFGYLALSEFKTNFPQNGTVSMTLDSGPYLYGAYRELGKWNARAITKALLEQTPRGRLPSPVQTKPTD